MNLFYRIKIKSKGSRCVVNFKGKILKSWHPVEVICKWFVHVFGRLAEDITVFGQCYIVIYMVDEVSTTVKIHQVGLLSKSATKKSHLVEFYCIFCRFFIQNWQNMTTQKPKSSIFANSQWMSHHNKESSFDSKPSLPEERMNIGNMSKMTILFFTQVISTISQMCIVDFVTLGTECFK